MRTHPSGKPEAAREKGRNKPAKTPFHNVVYIIHSVKHTFHNAVYTIHNVEYRIRRHHPDFSARKAGFCSLSEQSRSRLQTKDKRSDEHPFLPVILTELFRRAGFLLPEYPVEIRQVVESALIADFGYRHGRIHQQPYSISQTDVNDIVRQAFPCAQLEETAESHPCHPHHLGKLVEPHLLLIVFADIMLHFLNPPAVGLHLDFRE